MTRHEVLTQACDQCLKELYKYAVPHIEWEDFKKECKEYSKKYKEWDDWKMKNIPHPEWEGKSLEECIGPKPFEFYYLPQEIMKDICNSYVYAYKLDGKQELLDTINVLKEYCKDPIVDKWIEGENGNPGHRGYEHPENLEKEIYKYLDSNFTGVEFRNAEIVKDIFFKFLDMAGNFFNWNRDLNSFNATVYLGPSPNSNKERVIENWKKYRGKDIEINEKEIQINYYGDDED